MTETSSTITDLLITSDTSKITASTVFDLGSSDHCLIYSSLNLHKGKTPPRCYCQNFKHLKFKNLKYDIECALWLVIETFDNIGDMTCAWETIYKDILNEHLSERRAKVRSNSLPWMNSHIRKAKNRGFKALNRAKETGTKESWDEYKKLRNEVTYLLRTNQARTSEGWSEN